MTSQKLRNLLKTCTVRILSNGIQGTGFFVAPGLILTCAHVVISKAQDSDLDIYWQSNTPKYKARLKKILCRDMKQLEEDQGQDIAILELIDKLEHPCVEFDLSVPKLGSKMLSFGYSKDVAGESTFEYEGEGFKKDALLHTLKMGQAVPGMSGSPLLNLATERVCGILVLSRNTSSDLGARAIPATTIKAKLAEVFELNYQFHKTNKYWSNLRNKSVSRKISTCLAFASLILLVYFHFLPPDDAVHIYIARISTASLFSIAALLLVNNIESDLEVGKIELNTITSLVSFGVAFIVTLIFVNPLFGGDGYTRDGKISFQYFTGLDNLPVLSFVESKFPDELTKTVLNTSINPLVYRNSPAFSVLERFVSESGNITYLNNTSDAGFSYALNRNSYTSSGGSGRGGSSLVTGEKLLVGERRQSESREEFENSRVTQGEELSTGFKYADLLVPFQEELENSQWTSFVENAWDQSSKIRGEALQYPKLSSILESSIRDSRVPGWKKGISDDIWLLNIAKNNPNSRGFLGFVYRYIVDLSSNIFYPGCGVIRGNPDQIISLVDKVVSTPYIRFADILNSSKSDIRISSISYQVYGDLNNLYQLTEIKNRYDLFNNIGIVTDNLEPSGISLIPGQHFLLPIELGFDTRSQKNRYRSTPPTEKNRILKLVEQPLYIVRVDAKVKDYDEKGNQGITKKLYPLEDFIKQSKLLNELFQSIPKRFAVGTFINLDSIVIDGKSINLKPPLNDTSQVAASKHYMAGSCPYLVIRHEGSGRWETLGNVLYGRSGAEFNDTEIHYIGDKINSIRIEEREEEITYLDALVITYYDPRYQEIREVIPNIPESAKKIDGDYYLLKQDDFLEIDIKKILPRNAQNIRVKVSGYYVPLPAKDLDIPRDNLITAINSQM